MSVVALVVSKHDLNHRPLHRWLADLDGDLHIAIAGDAASATIDEPVANSGCQIKLHHLGHYASPLTELSLEQLCRREGVSVIASSSEVDVIRIARLRSRLGLSGQTMDSAQAYRDKITMKDAACAGGIRVPEHRALAAPISLIDFVADYDLPVVVKPRLESDSRGVAVLRDRAELEAWLASGQVAPCEVEDPYWMVERFIDAPMFHVDGLMSTDAFFGWPSAYSCDIFEALRQGTSIMSVQLNADDPRTSTLLAFARSVISVLPSPPVLTAFHLEAWLPSDGQPILCEVACRVGGGSIAAAMQATFGYHLAHQSLRSQVGLPLCTPLDRRDGISGTVLLQSHEQPPNRWFPPPSLVGLVGSDEPTGPAPRASLGGITEGSTTWVVHGYSHEQVADELRRLGDWWDSLHRKTGK